jgi:tetratricopeptide (TPR) repeat protein
MMTLKECTRPLSLLLATLAFCLSLAVAGCVDKEKAKAEYVRRGEAFLRDKKYQEASLEFRNALQIDDNLAAAHWGLAQAYEGLGRLQEALQELQRTVQLDPNNLDAKVKLGNYLLLVKPPQLDEAERLARDVLERDQNHIEGHILLGSVLFQRGDRDGALAELNRAVEIDPQRIESHLSLARFYVQTGELAKAEEVYKRAISINDRSALAHMEYGRFLASQKRFGDAEAQFRAAVDGEPQNREARLLLAGFYLSQRQLDKAEEQYKALAAMDGDRPDGRATLADFYAATGRTDEAIRIYQEIVAKSPDYARGRYRLSEILLQRGDVSGAAAQITELLKKNPRDTQALLMRARINLQDDPKRSIEDLKEVLRIESNNRAALYFMAEANLRAGQIEQARAFAGDLERFYPNYLPVKLMQARINLAGGDNATAQRLTNELLDQIAKTTPDIENTPEFLSDLKIRALITRGSAKLAQRDTRGARQDMQAAVDAAPNMVEPYFGLANVALAENKLDEAARIYEHVLQIDPINFNALSGLINAYAKLNRLNDAHARVDQALQQQPNSAPLHFLKAQVYGFERNAQGAEAELRRALELDANYLPAYFSLGALYVNLNQQDRAIAEFRKVTERRPDNAMAYTLIGMLEDSRRNYDAATEAYRKALQADPNNVIAANNLAWNYAEHGKGNLDEAVRLAQSVVQRFPDQAGFVDTLGWVYYKKGLHAAAVEQLRRVVARDGASPIYRYHLGMALLGLGDKEGARRELQEALRLGGGRDFPEAEEVRRALASL